MIRFSSIIEKLLKISTTDIVAPYVFIEPNHWWKERRFYDIGSFIDGKGTNFSATSPHNKSDGDILNEVNAVGTCMLIPAKLYYKTRYDPFDDRIEHISLCEWARGYGYKVHACPAIEIFHAFLPKYGEQFH